MTTTTTTHILKDHPGYSWIFDQETQQHVLVWKPIRGIYSPPRLENGMRLRTFPVTKNREATFLLSHLSFVQKKSRVRYIFLTEGVFELWSDSDRCLKMAVGILEQLVKTRKGK